MTEYDLIYADPPTDYKNWSARGEDRHAKNHYKIMSDQDLLGFFGTDVADMAAPDSILMLWATGPRLPLSLQLMEAAGFEFGGMAFVWVKLLRKWAPRMREAMALEGEQADRAVGNLLNDKLWHIGMGYTTRANPELVIYGKRGNGLPRQDKGVRALVVRPVAEHSTKPPIVRQRLEKLYGDVRRIELFARERAEGWDSMGDELEQA